MCSVHFSGSFTAPVERTLFEDETNMDTVEGHFVPSSYSFDEKAGLLESKTGTEGRKEQLGIDNFRLTTYKESRWCYDTPGVVNPNQVSYYTWYIFLTLTNVFGSPVGSL